MAETLEKPKPVIYFCGSMRGVQANIGQYQIVVNELQKYGKVLTMHVAYPDVQKSTEKGLSDSEIYERDYNWFVDSNIMVAEITSPSHGVGMELGWASLRKDYKVLCIAQKEKQFQASALAVGCPSFEYQEYTSKEDLIYIISNFLKSNSYNPTEQ